MNRMADTVIHKMDAKQREEDDKIRRYEMEREMRERMEDERRMMRSKQGQAQMRTFLDKQMDEKKRREAEEKALNDEQAVMWQKDLENYEEEERRMTDKIKRINMETAGFLQNQIGEKGAKHRAKMNRQEYLLNKPLLKEINEKKRASDAGGSQPGDGDFQ